jgi:hypothetical protein
MHGVAIRKAYLHNGCDTIQLHSETLMSQYWLLLLQSYYHIP